MRNFTIIFILLLISSCHSWAQVATRVVKGTLTDPQSGEPMPGVNIVIKGTTKGTVSDINGTYEIEAPIGSTLVFSFVGYATKEITVAPLAKSEKEDIPQKIFTHNIPDNPEKTLSPYFFVKSDNPLVDQLPLKSTTASVTIAGVIADVHIKQVYINTGNNTLEAVYIFPGSTRAAVYAMSMSIGNRKLIAKIKEKEKARHDYEQARNEGKTATLLEQKRPNVFQMNVANILPGDTITVALDYTELLIPTAGTYEFIYPTVVGPRYSEIPDDEAHTDEQWVENPYHHEGEQADYTVDLKAVLNAGIPIQKITSPSHKVNIQFEKKNSAVIRLDESENKGGNRDFILRYRLRGGAVESGLLIYPRQDENFFLLMIEPPEAPRLDQIPPREYIFIVDVSGSMTGFPISVSKKLLRNLISNLRPTDKFNVMLFESNNEMLHARSVPANEENIEDALRVLDRQQGGGGTRLYPALQNALSYRKAEDFSRTFVVITDGFVTIEKEAFNLVRDNLNEANLFAIGIGSSVNRYLVEGLAHAGMGEPFIVTNEKEAEVIGNRFKDFVEKPVLTNIKIDYGDFEVYDQQPVSIPDVFAERPIIIYGKYKGEAAGTIKLSGYSGNKTYQKTIDLNAATKEDNEALRYLWARNKIKYLADFAGYYEDDHYYKGNTTPDRAAQVTQLGLKYNLLTQYTSFIAIDSIVRSKTGALQKVDQPLPLPQGVSDGALSGVSLTPDVQALSEVVVAGYGVRAVESITCAIASVRTATTEFAAPISINQALKGRVSGAMVSQNSGAPGSNTSVMIRGNASVASDNAPLYIIDGVPVDNTGNPTNTAGTDMQDRIADINPHDIESIEVLKSTSANAIYGSRGANGVILVTTRKPKISKREISFTSSFSMEKVNKLPELQNAYAQGRPVGETLQWRGGDVQEVFSWGPLLKDLAYDGTAYDYDRNGRLAPAATGNGVPARAYNPYDFFRTGFTADNHLQISKGTEKIKYAFSVGNTLQKGIIPGSDFKRTTLRLSLEKKIIRKITMGASALLSNSISDLVQKGNSASSLPYGLFTTPPSFDNGNGSHGMKALKNTNTYELPDHTPRNYSGGVIDNPYWSIVRNPYRGTVSRIVPALYTDYVISDWLSVHYRVGADIYADQQRSGIDLYSAAAPAGQFTNRRETYGGLNSGFTINGKKSLADAHIAIAATVGLDNFFAQREVSKTTGIALHNAGMFAPENVQGLEYYSHTYKQQNSRFIAKVNLKYHEFLSLDLNSTREHTSTLSRGNNHLHSEGMGIAFNFTELPFLQYSGDVLSFGKVFASAGRIQKEAPVFLDPNFYAAATSDINASLRFAERLNIEKSINLGAEQVASLEAGTTLRFLQDRIALTASYYKQNTNNLMVPYIKGSSVSLMNGGTLANTGVELNLEVMPVNRNIQWTTIMNFTRYRSIVKALPDGVARIALAGFTSVASSLIAGQPYGVLYGTKYLRNEQGALVIDEDGFPLVDAAMGIIGDPNPDWLMGITNSFSYKDVSVGFLIDIKQGGDIWNGTKNTLDYYGISQTTGKQRETSGYIFPGVTEEGQPNTTPVNFADPAAGISGNRWVRYGRAGVAEDAIEDGSWVRLREVSLTYRFSQNIASRIGLRNLSLSLMAHNLFLLTRYSGIDPETNLTGNTNGRGLDYFNLPNYKRFGASLKLGL